jgi:hypothetical protein
MSGLARRRAERRINLVEEAMRLVLDPIGETGEIVEQVKGIVAKMSSEEVAEFR